MPRVDQRNGVWMGIFIVALVIGGLCAVGFWQTYDIKCGAFGTGAKHWAWTEFPPQYRCGVGV